jgi:mRNA-degrading endonuclease toxin of MazEF toxin-antitoxin module
MTTYNFGDIILIPFPFTDQTTSKKRPAVVVSSEAYNGDRPDIILMAVTSQVRLLGKTGGRGAKLAGSRAAQAFAVQTHPRHDREKSRLEKAGSIIGE